MDPRVARSRAAVLDATRASVLEHGVGGVSVADVCDRSGVARTTVYRHWDTAPELVLDALSAALDPPEDPDTGNLRDDLVVLVGGFARALSDGPLARLMATMLEAAGRDERFAAVHRREVARRHGVVRRVLHRGVERGELSAAVDVDFVLACLLGPVVYRALVAREPVAPDVVPVLVDQLLAAHRPARP